MESRASYEELMKQVLNLKLENTHLRRELMHSASHLTRLENDSSAMKDILSGLRTAAASDELVGGAELGLGDTYAERLSPPSSAAMPRTVFDHNYNSSDELSEVDNWTAPTTSANGYLTSDTAASLQSRAVLSLVTNGRANSPDVLPASRDGSCVESGQRTDRKLVSDAGRVTASERTDDRGRLSTEAATSCSTADQAVTASTSAGDAVSESSICSSTGTSTTKLVTIATQTSDIFLPEHLSAVDLAAESLYTDPNICAFYHGGWPFDRGSPGDDSLLRASNQETASMLSFTSSTNAASSASNYRIQQQLGTKVEMVCSLLSMLGTHDKDDMSQTLLAMSHSQDSCVAMRQSGCLPLLIQLLHGTGGQDGSGTLLGGTRGCHPARVRAAKALRNVVCSNPDSRRSRREERVLRLLEQIRCYCDELRGEGGARDVAEMGLNVPNGQDGATADQEFSGNDQRVGPATAALMKLSFDEEYRTAICTLGGLQAIAELLQLDDEVNGADTSNVYSITLRRYACMALTNLTYGDSSNKALLCALPAATGAIVSQLRSPDEDLRQVAASVLRNLSWRADPVSKMALRETGTVSALMHAAMSSKKEPTLKSILSALWNVSAHCTENKAAVCAIDGALEFLVEMLDFQGSASSNSPAVAENAGGVLRNVSSYVAVHEEHRAALRRAGALQTLLRQLRSSSLTVVSNACGTLWNLSARCAEDQQTLRELGAVAMLRSLVNSKHRMIAMGSTAALKNLLAARPNAVPEPRSHEGSANDRATSPGLHVRRQRRPEEDAHDVPQSANREFDSAGSFTGQRPSMLPVSGRSVADPLNWIDVMSSGGQHMDQVFSCPAVSDTGSDMGWYGGNSAAPHKGPDMKMRLANGQQASFSTGCDGSYYISRSVDNSPAAHRRAPLHVIPSTGSSSLDSGQMMRNQQGYMVGGSYGSWGSGSGLKTAGTGAAMSTASRNDAVHISRRMERVHLTDLHGSDQDEPINFSVKYTETPETSGHLPSTTNMQNMQPVRQPVPSLTMPQQMTLSQNVVRHAAGPMPTSVMPRGVQNFGRHMVLQGAPAGFVRHPAPAVTSQPVVFVRPPFQAPMGVVRGPSGFPQTYRKMTVDAEQPTNYSLQFAEQYDDDNVGHFVEQPIDYSTRYMEPQNGGSSGAYAREVNRRPVAGRPDEPSSFCEDTVKTFCTEGTPMNYLSTATSMNDLSMAKSAGPEFQMRTRSHTADDLDVDEVQDFSRKYSEPELEEDSGPKSDTGVGRISDYARSGHNSTGADRWAGQQMGGSYMYNDGKGADTGIMSPPEQPQRFCTEGTPPNFSHASSLSSLRSGDVSKTGGADDTLRRTVTNGVAVSKAGLSTSQFPKSHDCFMPILNRSESTDREVGNSQSAVVDTSAGSNTEASLPRDLTAHGGAVKTVTFDVESNQVQETPLMFSRCSSLGSLSSFDIHSVHSSVISEYSVRASQVVSPSELPDSPCDTMPPSPSTRAAASRNPPTFFGASSQPMQPQGGDDTLKAAGGQVANGTQANGENAAAAAADEGTAGCFDASDQSSPVHYCNEGNMSSRTSLSALTCDGEHIGVCKEPRTLPLGEESDDLKEDTLNGSQKVDQTRDSLEDEDSDSPVSEGEENLLAECITLAMPSKTSAPKMMVRSRSDGGPGSQNPQLGMIHHSRQPPVTEKLVNSPAVAQVVTRNSSMAAAPATSAPRYPSATQWTMPSQGCSASFLDGYDSPRKFATEDTPLNYSQSGSLSDLSSVAGENCTGAPAVNEIHKPVKSLPDQQNNDRKDLTDDKDDSDVSLSDDDIPDGDELLSQVIEAAMPKSQKHWKPPILNANSQAGGARSHSAASSNLITTSTSSQRPAAQSVEASLERANIGRMPNKSEVASIPKEKNSQAEMADARLNIRGVGSGQKMSGGGHGFASSAPVSDWMGGRPLDYTPADDLIVSYACEGTPVSYSRDRSPSNMKRLTVDGGLLKTDERSWNSSLSSLSFDSSLNAEPTAAESALLEECINAAMPKNRSKKTSRKPNDSHHQVLRTSPSGSSESSLKRLPAPAAAKPVDASNRQKPVAAGHSVSSCHGLSSVENQLQASAVGFQPAAKFRLKSTDHTDSNGTSKNSCQVVSATRDSPGAVDVVDITQESLPDLNFDDDTLPSGPSTEANNTVIYCGPVSLDPALSVAKPSTEVSVNVGPDVGEVVLAEGGDNLSATEVQTLETDVSLILSELSMKSKGDTAGVSNLDEVSLERPSLGCRVSNLEPFTEDLFLSSSTPNNQVKKMGPRVLKPSESSRTAEDQQQTTDDVGLKPVRGKRKSLTGRSLPSTPPRTSPKEASGSLVGSARSPVGQRDRNNPFNAGKLAGDKPRSTSPSGTTPVVRRRSMTPEKTSGIPLSISNLSAQSDYVTSPSARSGSSTSSTPKSGIGAKTLGTKSPKGSPLPVRTQCKTPPVNARQPGSSLPATPKLNKIPRKSPSSFSSKSPMADEETVIRPKPPVKQGTFTKEPSAAENASSSTVQQITRPVISDVTSAEGVDVGEEAQVQLSTSPQQPKVQLNLSPSSATIVLPSAHSKENVMPADSVSQPSGTELTSNYTSQTGHQVSSSICDDILIQLQLKNTQSKPLGNSSSVGNLLSIHSVGSHSVRSAQGTPSGGRKSLDSKLADIPVKKPVKSKISSLWHRDKGSKAEVDKNQPAADMKLSSDKPRDGLGKSPKSFRKSFPLRKAKKNDVEVVTSTTDVKPGLTRSGTYDMLTEASVLHSPESTFNNTVACPEKDEKPAEEGAVQVLSKSVNGAAKQVLHPSLDDLNDITASTEPVKTSKKLGIFKRFSKESKSKSKEAKGKEAEKEESAGGQHMKKKGFSFFRKEASSKKNDKSHENDAVWVRHAEGRELVKSATLPMNASASLIASRNGGASPKVPLSATTQSLLSSATDAAVILSANDKLNHFVTIHASSDTCAPDADSTGLTSRHLTKTEMLIARRRQSYGSSTYSDEHLSHTATDSDADSSRTTNSVAATAGIVTTV